MQELSSHDIYLNKVSIMFCGDLRCYGHIGADFVQIWRVSALPVVHFIKQ